jgi:hypothetical protein
VLARQVKNGQTDENFNPFLSTSSPSVAAIINAKDKALASEMQKKQRALMDKRNMVKQTARLKEKVTDLKEEVTDHVATIATLETRCDVLVEKVKEEKRARERNKKALQRVPDKQAKAIDAARTIHIKSNGVITEPIRELIRELAILVARARINVVLHKTAEAYGIILIGDISKTSISRIIVEGGIAAHIELCREIKSVKGACFCFQYLLFCFFTDSQMI